MTWFAGFWNFSVDQQICKVPYELWATHQQHRSPNHVLKHMIMAHMFLLSFCHYSWQTGNSTYMCHLSRNTDICGSIWCCLLYMWITLPPHLNSSVSIDRNMSKAASTVISLGLLVGCGQ